MDRKIRGLTLRELTGMGLLVGLLLLGLLASWYLGRQQQALSQALSDSAWLALSGQMENARSNAELAKDRWEKTWKPMAAVADHGPMEEIDCLFQEVRVYGTAGDQAEFARACTLLARKLEALGSTQKLSWWNLL